MGRLIDRFKLSMLWKGSSSARNKRARQIVESLYEQRALSRLKRICSFRLITTALRGIYDSRCSIQSVAPGTEEMVNEDEVGIVCYMNTLPGFRGTLKQRYSDFVVNEVSCSGVVIHLTCLDPSPEEPPAKILTASETTGISTAIDPASEIAENIEAFSVLVGKEDADQLETMLRRISKKEVDDLPPLLLAPDADKAHRAAVHNFFKSRLPFLLTDTVDGPGDSASSKCVRVRYFLGRSGVSGRGQENKRDGEWKEGKSKRQKRGRSGRNFAPFDSRGRDDSSASTQKFLLFHLFKENKNTQDALMVIGRMLGVQPKSFGFAGTKDKRAVTTQQVTVFKQSAAKLSSLNSRLFGIRMGNFSYVEKSLGLGELSGNHFTITLRNVVTESDGAVAEAAEGLREKGFVNYYGLQFAGLLNPQERFGNSAVATHTVGASLLKGEWETAVDLILQPRDGELAEIADARNYFQRTQDVDGALLRFPRHLGSERALLGGLKKQPGNWLMAFNCIPRTMRLMFVHSYQSYLWNHAASYRLRTYGVEAAVEGDLVYCEEVEHDAVSKSLEGSLKDTQVEPTSEIEVEEGLDISDVDVIPKEIHKAKHVTAEDVAAGKYTIADVVLPLPGSSILYPTNTTVNVYQELASKDSVDLARSPHLVKDYSISHMTGGYRHLVQKLNNFDWKILTYDDVTVPLSETDLDKIINSSKGESQLNSKTPDIESETTASNLGGGDRKALQLGFTLPASSYATMAIRELLKTSTSVAFHKSLNEEAEVAQTHGN